VLYYRFAISEGNVTYQCRFLQSNTLRRNRAAERIVVSEFGTGAVPDPCHTIFDRLVPVYEQFFVCISSKLFTSDPPRVRTGAMRIVKCFSTTFSMILLKSLYL
jgi:hypothetical protein